MACIETPAAVKPLELAQIDAHELLDSDQRMMLRVMRRDRIRKKQEPISFLDFAKISIRATAHDFVEAADGNTEETALVSYRALLRAALLYAYEATRASEEAIVYEWSERDEMLRTLEVLFRELP